MSERKPLPSDQVRAFATRMLAQNEIQIHAASRALLANVYDADDLGDGRIAARLDPLVARREQLRALLASLPQDTP